MLCCSRMSLEHTILQNNKKKDVLAKYSCLHMCMLILSLLNLALTAAIDLRAVFKLQNQQNDLL